MTRERRDEQWAPGRTVYMGDGSSYSEGLKSAGDINIGGDLDVSVTGSASRSVTDQRPAIDAFVSAFRAVLDDSDVPEDQRAQVAADIATIDAQLAAPVPNVTIVARASARYVRSPRTLLRAVSGLGCSN